MTVKILTDDNGIGILTNVAHLEKSKSGYEVYFIDGSMGFLRIKKIIAITDSFFSNVKGIGS